MKIRLCFEKRRFEEKLEGTYEEVTLDNGEITYFKLPPWRTKAREDPTALPYECKKDGYTITIAKPLTPQKDQALIAGDHAFAGETYQDALGKNIQTIRKNYGIYDCR